MDAARKDRRRIDLSDRIMMDLWTEDKLEYVSKGLMKK